MVIFYKRQNEQCSAEQMSSVLSKDDFCLIVMNKCQSFMLKSFGHNVVTMDSTHGLNPYDFEMTTLMVLDEYGQGFPGACMFTNRKDTQVQILFLSLVSNNIGKLSPNVFISDMAPIFYNAWISVMGIPKHHLYCSWHVDRAWQKNMSKIKDDDKKKYVYKTLKLLQTTEDVNEFTDLYQKSLLAFREDSDLKDFVDYFEQNYSQNTKTWAYCFRKECGINTTMCLESMHKTIKYFHLDGKHVQRLDKGLNSVVNYIKDKVVERIVKSTKGKTINHEKDILNRHRLSLVKNFEVNVLDNSKFSIESVNSNELYIVEYVKNICCKVMCKFCNIFVHSFCCQCRDNLNQTTICQHIHYIATHFKTDVKTDSRMAVNIEHLTDHFSSLDEEKLALKKQSKSTKRNLVLHSLETVTNKCRLILAEDNDDKISDTLAALRKMEMQLELIGKKEISENVLPKNVSLEPPNKKIKKQLSFHSTKKRKANKNVLFKKPNDLERKSIKEVHDELYTELHEAMI